MLAADPVMDAEDAPPQTREERLRGVRVNVVARVLLLGGGDRLVPRVVPRHAAIGVVLVSVEYGSSRDHLTERGLEVRRRHVRHHAGTNAPRPALPRRQDGNVVPAPTPARTLGK